MVTLYLLSLLIALSAQPNLMADPTPSDCSKNRTECSSDPKSPCCKTDKDCPCTPCDMKCSQCPCPESCPNPDERSCGTTPCTTCCPKTADACIICPPKSAVCCPQATRECTRSGDCKKKTQSMDKQCPMHSQQQATKVETTPKSLLGRLAPYALFIAYYLHLDGKNFIPAVATDPQQAACQAQFNKALQELIKVGFGVWIVERLKADARDLEAAIFNLLPQLSI